MDGIAADKITLLKIKDNGKALVMPFLDNSDVKAGYNHYSLQLFFCAD